MLTLKDILSIATCIIHLKAGQYKDKKVNIMNNNHRMRRLLNLVIQGFDASSQGLVRIAGIEPA